MEIKTSLTVWTRAHIENAGFEAIVNVAVITTIAQVIRVVSDVTENNIWNSEPVSYDSFGGNVFFVCTINWPVHKF